MTSEEPELTVLEIERMESEGGKVAPTEITTPKTQSGDTPRVAACNCSCPGKCPEDCPPSCACSAHLRNAPNYDISGDEP